MRRIRWGDADAAASLEALPFAGETIFMGAEEKVAPILDGVRNHGDLALVQYTKTFDDVVISPDRIPVPEATLKEALGALPAEAREALELAAGRIRDFHEACLPQKTETRPAPGERFALRPIPLRRVGFYIPGGRGAYPSSVLMSAVPARVAGVEEIVMCSPPAGEDGEIASVVLAAAALAGVDRVFRVGGAQAIAAMAYGTESIGKVDKIVGPGNIFVAAAKRLVRDVADVDKDAGPSEVVVILDSPAHAEWAAADLIAQAEHDPSAMAAAVAIGGEAAGAVDESVARQVESAHRREVIEEALKGQGAIVEVSSCDEALEVAERLAPEHLELMIERPGEFAARVRSAGAILLGPWSGAPFGDYIAGPNHILPTGKAARFASPLGVLDFLKWSSEVELDSGAAARLAGPAARLAELEGFPAHARALRMRAGGEQ
ncbi:MAG: histidinol dehydrogenase [Nitrospinota bacterium]|nr:histidinol dehydrogenase [Nitrospinota bacterium]